MLSLPFLALVDHKEINRQMTQQILADSLSEVFGRTKLHKKIFFLLKLILRSIFGPWNLCDLGR